MLLAIPRARSSGPVRHVDALAVAVLAVDRSSTAPPPGRGAGAAVLDGALFTTALARRGLLLEEDRGSGRVLRRAAARRRAAGAQPAVALGGQLSHGRQAMTPAVSLFSARPGLL